MNQLRTNRPNLRNAIPARAGLAKFAADSDDRLPIAGGFDDRDGPLFQFRLARSVACCPAFLAALFPLPRYSGGGPGEGVV